MNHAERIIPLFDELGVDAFLLTDPNNMRYISGFAGEGTVYVSRKTRAVITDSRYTEAAGNESPFTVIEFNREKLPAVWLSELAEADGARVIGYEDLHLTVAEFENLKEKMSAVSEWKATGDKVSSLRMVKTAEEIAFLARAEEIGDLAFADMLGILKPGMTELEVAAELEYRMKKHGSEGISFDTIIASGANSSMPHAVPSTKKLETGDFVTMDFGAMVSGYHSDMTRTVVLGKADEKQKEIYDIVLRAQLAALDAIRPGAIGKDVDEVARGLIREAGYGEYFGHGLGHGVGLEIHEKPRYVDEITLEEGMVITDEPGIYLPGFGGVRIEDMVVVTADGCRNLTSSPKELIEL